jgi:hypothetical protein
MFLRAYLKTDSGEGVSALLTYAAFASSREILSLAKAQRRKGAGAGFETTS